MTTPAKDRFIALQASSSLNGVDFVELDELDPAILRVHFVNAVTVDDPSLAAAVTGGDSIPTVPLAAINRASDWSTDPDGRPLLTLHAKGEGDFSNYVLTVTSPFLDRMFTSASFSFKAFCPSDFDCLPPAPYCPPDETDLPPIDYLAKDYSSFRRALLDFSALRYPAWQERSEADFGVMFAEALSALADELSYQQDRVGAEAALETATQRRSLVSLARLVDYEPRPAISGTTLLMLNVAGPPIPAGVRISASAPDESLVPFEIGEGLSTKPPPPASYPVNAAQNWPIAPYWWDDKTRCLPRLSTEMWVAGHGFGFSPGQRLLIQTDLPGESIRQIVTLTELGEEVFDPLFQAAPGAPVTRIAWGPDDALERERDLTQTLLGGNLLPATQGLRVLKSWAIDEVPALQPPNTPLAIARRGPNATDALPNFVHRIPLQEAPLAYLAGPDADTAPSPEIIVRQVAPTAHAWDFSLSLLDADSLEQAYTVDPVAWRPVATKPDGTPTQWEIDGDGAETVRFGDGVFGLPPSVGDVFEVEHRVGLGVAGNVAADSITQVEPSWTALVIEARNPFPVTDGADAETAEHIRRMAPQAFRARQFRAVRPEDYVAAAEELPWVQQAGSCFRWTGSWLTVFTAADPKGSEVIALDQHIQLIRLLNRRRLAGYESYAPAPRYVSIDLEIEVCVSAESLPGEVEKRVLERLGSAQRPDGSSGFFFADRFTFGSPLYRSALEAAIQGVAGVAGVLSITYRRRGALTGFIDLPEVFELASDEILRIDNDPDWPERGIIRIIPEGGR